MSSSTPKQPKGPKGPKGPKEDSSNTEASPRALGGSATTNTTGSANKSGSGSDSGMKSRSSSVTKRQWWAGYDTEPKMTDENKPKGEPGCLEGLLFVATGVFNYMNREEFNDLVMEYVLSSGSAAPYS